jgi:hypothetical protein
MLLGVKAFKWGSDNRRPTGVYTFSMEVLTDSNVLDVNTKTDDANEKFC